MAIKRIFSLIIACAVILFGGYSVYQSIELGDVPVSFFDIPQWANRAISRQFSKSERLGQIAPVLMLSVGAQEQDGIFITKNALFENIAEPKVEILSKNLKGLEEFLSDRSTPSAIALIPTACAIKQQELPSSVKLFNQKALIADCYEKLSGKASTIDAYSRLFAAKNQYTYYRTEPQLTGLGGYYVYTAITSRLGITPRPLDQFEVENLEEDFYGSLYSRSGFKGVSPDLITLYRFSRFSRQYKLSVTQNGEQKSYYTLFPTHLSALGEPKSVIFGGLGERMDISVASPYEDSLLIFADNSVLSYLPFLVVHYGNITYIDLSKCTEEQLSQIKIDDYNQILFSYSVDNFMHKDICSAAALIK